MSEYRTTKMNMNNQLLSGLLALGLTEKEASLYLSAIRIGPATAQRLSQESDIKRATVYPHLESLISKGLFHVEMRGVRKVFIAEPPEKLGGLLDVKRQVLMNIMPALVQEYTHASPTANTIKIYYGLAGIKLIYDDILNHINNGDEYLVISDQEKWYSLDPAYFESFIKKRARLNLNIKLLLQDSVHAREFLNKQYQYNEEIKLFPKHIDININMVILSNKVIITQIVDPVMVIYIENPNVAAMQKIVFNTLWEMIGRD